VERSLSIRIQKHMLCDRPDAGPGNVFLGASKKGAKISTLFRLLTAGFCSDHPQHLAEHLFFYIPPKDINRFTPEHDTLSAPHDFPRPVFRQIRNLYI